MEPHNQKAITLEQFKRLDIDIVMATIPEHFESFAKLVQDYKPNAKLVFQFGNDWKIMGYPNCKNALASVAPQPVPPGCNAVFYHQEFDTNIYNYQLPVESRKITSFLHCFNVYWDTPLFFEMERLIPEWEFKAYGAASRDGVINGDQDISDIMHQSRFIWHVKHTGDGFGYIVHQAFATGRPPIVKRKYYDTQMAQQLMEDEVTCICIDGLSAQEIVNKVLHFSEPELYNKMSEAAYRKFKEVVDYDKEEIEIRKWLDNLV